MVIRLQYKCDDPQQVVNITLTETDTDCNVKVQADPLLLPGTPNPYGVLEKFLSVLDSFELPVKSDNDAIDQS